MPAAPAAPPVAPPTQTPASTPAAPSRPAPKPAAAKPAAPAPAKPQVRPSTVRTPAVPQPAPEAKVTNPFDEAEAEMDRFAGDEEADLRPPGARRTPPKPARPGETEEEPAATPNAEAEMEEQPAAEEQPKVEEEKLGPDGKPLAEKGGRASPWKLVDTYKKRSADLEKQLAEIQAKGAELPKEVTEKLTALEARNKELEDEMRFVDYKKSKEFVETYQQPYEEAWKNAIDDLKELTVTNDNGTVTAATVDDMMTIANLPLGKARELAEARFGNSANDIMAHRRVLRDLADKQTKALEQSQKMRGEREQKRNLERETFMKARMEETAKAWNTINEQMIEQYDYLRPVEGEVERNERLEKARTMVDETMKKKVGEAKTQEERNQILKAHAAVRNRAIGFSVLKHENKSLKARVAELEKSLAAFEESEPNGSDPRRPQNGNHFDGSLDAAVEAIGRL